MSELMAACANCHAANDAAAAFCASCGASLVAACASCGGSLPKDAGFCPTCGTPARSPQPAPGGQERRVVTLLFADLLSSTALGERLDPERLHDVLDRYFAAMREEIEAEGGTVEKFIGDAVVAAFGTPVAHEDDPARALRAALRMRARLEIVNAELQPAFDVTLAMRIGVNTGDVLAAVDPAPGEPMFTGDAVNTAARFEQHAAPGQILASERTVRAARGFTVADAGSLDMKGKVLPVPAFEVLGEGSPAARGLPGLSAPMVGRDAELELLTSLLARIATERRPHLVTVYGEPGVGKSRLMQEFLSRVEGGERRVVRGRCLPYGDGVTYWPFAEILKTQAGVLDTDPPSIALDRVRAAGVTLLGDDLDAVRATAVLAYTMGLEDPEVRLDELDPAQVREEIGVAWRRFFGALSRDAPVLALVEDIHWADPALLDLLEQLAEWIEGPVLFLCPARPELLGDRPTWGGGKRNYSGLALEPLTADESEDLIRALLDIDDLPAAVHREILERAGGNPFFLEEIVRRLVDGGHVIRDGERWRATGDVSTVEIPDTVQAVLAARIDLLEPASRRALQAAAVIGRVFWPGAIARLMDGGEGGVIDALASLQARDLIRPRPTSALAGQPEYIFKHVLTRDVAYDTLSRAARASAHALVARWLEDTVGDRVGEFIELLAHHYVEAHRAGRESASSDVDLAPLRRRAFDLSLQASHSSRRRNALHRVERFARQAMDLADGQAERSLAAEALAVGYFDAYMGSEAWDAYAIAIEAALADPERDPVRVARLCAGAAQLPTRWPGSMRTQPPEGEVERLIEIGLAHAPPGDSEERVRLLGMRAAWPFAFPGLEFDDAQLARFMQDGVDAAEAALRLGLPDLASGAFDAAAVPTMIMGDYGTTTQIETRRLKLVDQLRDPLEVGDTFAMMSWCSVHTGHYRDASRYADRGLGIVRGVVETATIHLLSWSVNARYHLGEWEEALLGWRELLEHLGDRREDPPYFATMAYAAVAMIHEHRGERAEAGWLSDILTHAAAQPPVGAGPVRPWTTMGIPLMVARGDLEGAAARILDPVPGWRTYAPSLYDGAGEWVAAAGEWDRAPAMVEEMRAFATFGGCRPIAWAADLLEARWLARIGDGSAAVAAFGRARSGYGEGEASWRVAICDLEIAVVRGIDGLDPDERRRFDDATARFEQLRSVRDLDRVRSLLGEGGASGGP